MEKLNIPEIDSIVLPADLLDSFQEETVDIETDYLEPEECLYTVAIRATTSECDLQYEKGHVTGFYVVTHEFDQEDNERVCRVYFFNNLDDAFCCYKAIRDKYKQVEAENKSKFEKQQRQEALYRLVHQD